jgi:hypothetical protein
VTSVIAGGASLHEAQRRNRSIANQRTATRRAERLRQEQAEDQGVQARQVRQRRGRRLRGALLAAGAEAGVSLGGSFGQAADVELFNEQEDIEAIIENLRRGNLFAGSQTSAELARLDALRDDPRLAALAGGVQGAQAGLSFASGFNDLIAEPAPPQG